MKSLFLLLSLLLYLYPALKAQNATFPLTNYTTKNYGREFNATNQAVIIDHRGIVYAANGFKLLEYDGSVWKSYPINKETWILSLAVDSKGLIYAGSQNEFGFFTPDDRGELRYQSLSDSLREEDKDFSNIWKVHALSDGVFFQSEEKLFIFKNRKVETIVPQTSFHTSFKVNDRLFIRERNMGLLEWNNNSLKKIRGSEIFNATGIFFMLPYGKKSDKILIGTRDDGLWIYDSASGTDSFVRLRSPDEKLLKKAVITGGTATGNGCYAIGTMLDGVYVIDSTGVIKAKIDTKRGLTDNEVKDLVLDHLGNLWLALNNGISRIEINSPLSVFNEKSGITGSVNSIIRFENQLYIGTSSGLFKQDKTDKLALFFKPVLNISVPIRSLVNAGGLLIAATDAGLYQVNGNEAVKVDSEASYTLYYDTEFKILFSGGRGLNSFRSDRVLTKINSLKISEEDIIGITRENKPSGKEPEFWLGTWYNGVFRIKVNKDLTFIAENYGRPDGLPEGFVIPVSISGETLFATGSGLYTFTNEIVVRESLPDSLKDNKEYQKGYFSSATSQYKTFRNGISALSESEDRIWICSDNIPGYLDKKDSLKFSDYPFRGIEAGKINTLYPDGEGICWIGATEGLIKYDGNVAKDYKRNYFSLIRRVTLIDIDSSIFLGTGFSKADGVSEILPGQPSTMIITLPFRNNSLRFDFTSPYFEYQDKILYSYKLSGRSSKWSQWSKENYQEFTNLGEGKYTFTVKAKNIYGTESTGTSYRFTILPPWYRTSAAYIAYVILAIVALWISARLYSMKLKRENIRLEGIIAERTAEIVRQRDEIVQKNYVLEYQKKEIEDSIRYASRIQSAVIPSEKLCQDIFPESFVFFSPLNIVSGDFYWISRIGKKIIYTAADCTGHGVPGAFMSMLGVAFLNEIVNKDNIISPELILDNLRDKVIKALQQQGVSGETRDGMDIALACIDLTESKLEFAGAYNPIVLIRKGEIIEIRGDKMPIGFYENMNGFIKHDISIEKGDVFYMYSDGYEDQFGGPEGKKFKSKRLKNLLLEIHEYPVQKQKEILESTFIEWKGELPQVDDIVVVGIAIK